MPRAMVNGININYRVQGKGEPLVLIGGYSTDQIGWIFQTGAFKNYYRIITFDNRGVGKTDKPGGAYSTKMMADDTVALMDHLGIKKAHVLGVSMGGRIAQEIAVNYPDRINKLILVCTYAGWDESSGPTPEFSRVLALVGHHTGDDARSIPILDIADTVCSLAFNGKLYRIVFIPIAKMKARLTGNTGLLGQIATAFDTSGDLYTINVPTLVITGTKDRVVKPTSSEAIVKLIPNAKLVKIEGGSHALTIEMKGRFNKEVLDFLRA